MQNRRWMAPAVVTTVFILAVAAVFAFAFWSRGEVLAAPAIPVTSSVALRPVAVLTDKNPKYTATGQSWRDTLWPKIPESIRMRFFSNYSPSAPFEVHYGTIEPGDARFIMRVEYPEDWLTSKDAFQLTQAVENALDTNGMKYCRVAYGKGSYSSPSNVNVGSGPTVYSGGRLVDAMPYVSLDVRDLPFYVEELELQFLGEWDERSSVTKSLQVDNPYYQEVDPLPEPQPLPQTVTNGDVEVTLRSLVSKTTKDMYVDFRTRNGESVAIARPVGKHVAVSDVFPPDFFPRADGTAAQPYHSLAVFDVQQKGNPEPEWGLSDADIYYGKALYEWGINSWSMQGQYPAMLLSFPGDLALANQPVKVVATLNRKNNFPPDEKQTVEVALPEEGDAVRPGVAAKLWDAEIVVEVVSYKTKVPFMEPFSTEPDKLSVGLNNIKGFGDLREIYLIKTDGTTISLSSRRASGTSTGRTAIMNYNLDPGVSYGSTFRAPNYDECTTLGLTFIRARDYPHKFEFTARPVDATGKWEPE